MRIRLFRPAGMTMLEIMLVLAIVSTVASMVVPNLLHAQQTAQRVACEENRRVIEEMDGLYTGDHSQPVSELEELVAADYLAAVPRCPAGGLYAWVPAEFGSERALVCSVHGMLEGRGLVQGPFPDTDPFGDQGDVPADEDESLADGGGTGTGEGEPDLTGLSRDTPVVPTAQDAQLARNLRIVASAAKKYFTKNKSFEGFASGYAAPKRLSLHDASGGQAWGNFGSRDVVLGSISGGVMVLQGYSPKGYAYTSVIDMAKKPALGVRIARFETSVLSGASVRYRR